MGYLLGRVDLQPRSEQHFRRVFATHLEVEVQGIVGRRPGGDGKGVMHQRGLSVFHSDAQTSACGRAAVLAVVTFLRGDESHIFHIIYISCVVHVTEEVDIAGGDAREPCPSIRRWRPRDRKGETFGFDRFDGCVQICGKGLGTP